MAHQLTLGALLAFGGGRGHHGPKVVFLVLIVAIIVVAIVLLRQRRSARAVLQEPPTPSHPPVPPTRESTPPRSPAPGAADAQPATGQPFSAMRLETAADELSVPRLANHDGPRTIVARGLIKYYGEKLAVDDLSFDVRPGHVTGFLGPNGAGKSTTMRLIMGLDAPNSGSVRVNGQHYKDLAWPLREVGALLEARAVHPGRSAYSHLRMLAQTNQIPRARVDEVIDVVGLTSVARQLVGNFSLGMGQRLGIAEALLGDPGILLFDEPVNGLDTDGIRWVRGLLRRLASEGRTVFVSSHLMTEMALTADQVVVIGKGRLLAETSIEEFTSRNSQRYVRVRSPELDRLRKALVGEGGSVSDESDGSVSVRGLEAERIGALSLRESIVLSELAPQTASLEEAFIESTEGDLEYRGDRHQGADGAKGVV
jgi:ABC-2 type transport system ATP-binding protein